MADVSATLAERGARYGSFRDHAIIAQGLKRVYEKGATWPKLDDVKRQALEVFADKIARILNGDPEYADNWHDIAGYSTLVERDLLDPSTPSGEFVKQPPLEVSATPPAPAPIPAAVVNPAPQVLPKITPPVVKS